MLAPIRDLLGDGVDPVERVELELCGSRVRVQGHAEEDEVPPSSLHVALGHGLEDLVDELLRE
jgi:hypothetical protein